MVVNEIVTWQKTYSVNIPLIDSQHVELVKLTNKLYRSCLQDRNHSKKAFMEGVRGTVDYVVYHFSTEEKIMERVNYPDMGAHKKEHSEFVKEVLKTVENLTKGINYSPLSFVKFLKDWVLTHIAVSDTALGKYLVVLKQRGLLNNINFRVKKVKNGYIFE
jgi:hemerythrin